MLAYKFRSPAQMSYSLDIIFNDRLFCADWSRLNDPMEGIFIYSYEASDEADYSKKVDEIQQHKKRIKICSLCKTYNCHLLWAHYAAGFSGMAIEIELPDDCSKVREVTYGGVFAAVHFPNDQFPDETAHRILVSKYSEWSYEKEVRILNDQEWYDLEHPVRRIIVGHRMDPPLFKGLQMICERQGITINLTGIGDEGIDADPVAPLASAPPAST